MISKLVVERQCGNVTQLEEAYRIGGIEYDCVVISDSNSCKLPAYIHLADGLSNHFAVELKSAKQHFRLVAIDRWSLYVRSIICPKTNTTLN